jgi:hypothetical protein
MDPRFRGDDMNIQIGSFNPFFMMSNKPIPKIKEPWDDLQKRVVALEKGHAKPIFRGWHEGAVIVSIVGLIIIGLYYFAVHAFWIYFIGALLFGCGIAIIILLQLLKLGTSAEKKTRLGLIEERGQFARCIYLDGSLPVDENSEKGFCNLYNQNLDGYPYCIYCKNYKLCE